MTIKVNKKFDNVDAGIENMLAAAVADYATMSFGKNSTMRLRTVGSSRKVPSTLRFPLKTLLGVSLSTLMMTRNS
jgi:hypothetical protein